MERVTKKEIKLVAKNMGVDLLPMQIEFIQKNFGKKLVFVSTRGGRRKSLRDVIKEVCERSGIKWKE